MGATSSRHAAEGLNLYAQCWADASLSHVQRHGAQWVGCDGSDPIGTFGTPLPHHRLVTTLGKRTFIRPKRLARPGGSIHRLQPALKRLVKELVPNKTEKPEELASSGVARKQLALFGAQLGAGSPVGDRHAASLSRGRSGRPQRITGLSPCRSCQRRKT